MSANTRIRCVICGATMMLILTAGIASVIAAEVPGWQGYRQQRLISGHERLKVLRQEQKEELQKFLAALPGIAAQQQDTLIVWFQRYQGRLIEDPQAWQAQLPFLQELALDIHLTSEEKQQRLKQHLAVQCRQYERAAKMSAGFSEGTSDK